MRIPPVIPGTRPELAEHEARIQAARGRISPLYQVLMNSPPLAHGWEQMLSAVRNTSTVPAALRELVILRVAVLNGARYEFDAHAPIARGCGLSDEVIEAIGQRRIRPGVLNTPEHAVAELTDLMTQELLVPDALFARLQDLFDARQLVDLVATVAAYNMVSRFLVALEIGH